jgi:hypothetical protein
MKRAVQTSRHFLFPLLLVIFFAQNDCLSTPQMLLGAKQQA